MDFILIIVVTVALSFVCISGTVCCRRAEDVFEDLKENDQQRRPSCNDKTELAPQKDKWSRSKKRESEIDFYLPLIMERVSLAVQAGLDILPAIKAATESDTTCHEGGDPVTELLVRVVSLAEGGMTVEGALENVALSSQSTPLRHAFIHLGLAHREGGEISFPLRELADATQLYYQEKVEEEIARLPVVATMPLLLTFVGLILCFLTTPIIQVTKLISSSALP